MHIKSGFEQSVYALLLLDMLPEKAVLPGEAISEHLSNSPSYLQKLIRKLVHAGIVTSVTGVKGGFKLSKKSKDIRIYDVYVAIEGNQSMYSSNGVLSSLLRLDKDDCECLLEDIMLEAESNWINTLKQKTISTLAKDLQSGPFDSKVKPIEKWIQEKMVL